MEYEVKIENFEGPLELLYQLVKKNRIEISEISLADLTDQYLQHINLLEGFNLELASEFIVIAAELIELKARTLLPQEEEEPEKEVEESSLVQRLKEYHLIKQVTQLLNQYEDKAGSLFSRPADAAQWIEEPELILDLELDNLREMYLKALQAGEELKKASASENIRPIERDKISMEDKVREIKDLLLANREGVSFNRLIKNQTNRLEIIVTLLSILELSKLREVKLKQDMLFSEIKVISS